MDWETPPVPQTRSGVERRVGVELEFIGPNVGEVCRLIERRFGGVSVDDSAHRRNVDDTRLGDFTIELDFAWAHPPEPGQSGEISDFRRRLEAHFRGWLGDLGGRVLPLEIVAPPIPWSQLHELDGLIEDLRAIDARGAGDGVLYAFGAQLNPEVSDPAPASILAILRSYLLLSPWLRHEIDVDVTRDLAAFAKPFPETYQRLVLSEAYRPDQATLMDDYIRFNPTRNRELDLLPLFRWLDEDRVRAALPDETINARPTFHYRLPNMALNDPQWRLRNEWNRWLTVEKLAARPDLMSDAAATLLRSLKDNDGDWLPASRLLAARLKKPK